MIVKGTEYFDGKTQRYVDYPITDVLQMMGRAGRPQYDDKGVAVILVHDIKKHYYKKFLYEPFPVESKYSAELIIITVHAPTKYKSLFVFTRHTNYFPISDPFLKFQFQQQTVN